MDAFDCDNMLRSNAGGAHGVANRNVSGPTVGYQAARMRTFGCGNDGLITGM